jgi:hypothetical protein
MPSQRTGPDAFEGGVNADAIRQLPDRAGRRVVALGDDVRGSKLAGQRLASRMPAEGDDPGGAQALGRNDCAQANCTVPHDGHNAARPNASAHGHVVAGAHDVGERQQRAHDFV